jgi:peptidoglycan/LPS O-acetylase OafA/YrhL
MWLKAADCRLGSRTLREGGVSRGEQIMRSDSVSNIQILRGVAALLVVVYHILPPLNAVFHNIPHLHFGAFGVDIFFVISGFVMYYSNQQMGRSVRGFLLARFIRIVPLYWLATLVIVALVLVGFNPVGVHGVSPQMVLESAVFVPGTFPGGRRDLILSIGWTLMYELFFYFWFALSFQLRSAAQSFAAVSAVFVILSIVGYVVPSLPYLMHYYTSPIILEFLFGGLLAFAYLNWPERKGRVTVGFAWLAIAAGFALILLQDAMGLPVPKKDALHFLLFGGPAFLVVAGALVLERADWTRRKGFVQLLGAASYSLYLFHPVVVQSAVKAMAHVVPRHNPFAAPVLVLLATASAVIAAILVHLLVERRLLAIGKSFVAWSGWSVQPKPQLAPVTD